MGTATATETLQQQKQKKKRSNESVAVRSRAGLSRSRIRSATEARPKHRPPRSRYQSQFNEPALESRLNILALTCNENEKYRKLTATKRRLLEDAARTLNVLRRADKR